MADQSDPVLGRACKKPLFDNLIDDNKALWSSSVACAK